MDDAAEYTIHLMAWNPLVATFEHDAELIAAAFHKNRKKLRTIISVMNPAARIAPRKKSVHLNVFMRVAPAGR